MSRWENQLPTEVYRGDVIGQGMNGQELTAHCRLAEQLLGEQHATTGFQPECWQGATCARALEHVVPTIHDCSIREAPIWKARSSAGEHPLVISKCWQHGLGSMKGSELLPLARDPIWTVIRRNPLET